MPFTSCKLSRGGHKDSIRTVAEAGVSHEMTREEGFVPGRMGDCCGTMPEGRVFEGI
jgi:hypothetical protein